MSEKLEMRSMDVSKRNLEIIKKFFPNAVAEAIKDGKTELVVDFDALKQELSPVLLEEKQERFQMTWPDKGKSKALANTQISATLRPIKEKSVNFDTTKNLYIEGDNLDVLKLLRETYLGKIKMIYIDPPYNTGNDFVYSDDFAQSNEEYMENSGQYDEQGNRLFQNTESNGRFHTDWLNMIYPRLKVAKDLLSDDGAIFIHIDENEVYSLQTICNEIFGSNNELGTIIWDKRNPKGAVAGVAYQHESIILYCKDKSVFSRVPFVKEKEHAKTMIAKVGSLIQKYGELNNSLRDEYKQWLKSKESEYSGGELAYSSIDDYGNIYRCVSMAAPDKPDTRSHRPLIHPITKKPCKVPAKGWRFTDQTMDSLLKDGKIEFGIDESTVPNQKYYLKDNLFESVSSLIYYGGSDDAMGLPFDNPKPIYIAKKLISTICRADEIVLDFFSGSATTAHAVMQLNAEDGGNRKFIMVQLPELCDKKSEAYKAGYQTICDIGEERIRRAGKKIIEEEAHLTNAVRSGAFQIGMAYAEFSTSPSALKTQEEIKKKIDIGFRVLKLDSSNMQDVYYNPHALQQTLLDQTIDNIKVDRSPLDLLFQIMLDLGVELSANIEEKIIHDKTVLTVNGNDIIACFDNDITNDVIVEIAKQQPIYAVFKDKTFATDSVGINNEQLFKTYSPATIIKVL